MRPRSAPNAPEIASCAGNTRATTTCGSSLFFDPPARDWIGIAMGAFDTPTSTRLAMHVFVAEKGDYYEIADGLPQNRH